MASVIVGTSANAGDGSSKSGYTLFSPTPAGQMRELSPDRPDTTESPVTVDAGHVQIEFSFAEWGKGTGGGEETSILPFDLKLGLTNYADLELIGSPYLRRRAPGRTDEGAGDTTLRLKVNLWGNDNPGKGPWETALGVIPFVTFPTGADAFTANGGEGGVVLPFSISLPGGFDLGTMAEFDFVRDGGGGHDTLFVFSASLSRDLVGDLGAYVEYAGFSPLDGSSDYEAYGDFGLTYKVSDNVQLDAGVNVGLNAAAEDLRVFGGMTVRL